MLGKSFQTRQNGRFDLMVVNQEFVERGQLLRCGQFTLKEQVRRFLERAALGKLVNIVTSIDQLSRIAIDIADFSVRRNDPLESSSR